MGRRKKLINHTDIPQYEIEKIARCILPDVLAYYDSEEGRREFAEWKAQREQAQTQGNDTEIFRVTAMTVAHNIEANQRAKTAR